MKKLLIFLLAALVSTPAVALPHGSWSPYTSVIPSPATYFEFKVPVLDPRVTFTRAGPAEYFDSTGTLQTAAANTPRFDYLSPTSPSLCGLEIEEARTNNVLWSRDLTNAVWSGTSITAAKDQTGLDAVSNSASSLQATAANATVTQAITVAGTNQVFSVFLKRISGTGAVQLTTNGGTNWTTVTLTGGWNRFGLAGTANPTVGIRLAASGDKIAADVAQLETGVDYTSPIVTTTSTAPRAQDAASATVTSWWNAPAGTLEAEWVRPNVLSNAVDYAASVDDGTGNNNVSVLSNSNIPSGRVTVSGTGYLSAGLLPQAAAGTLVKGATTYGAGTGAFSGNSNNDLVSTQFNATPSTDISNATVPGGLTTIRFGNRQDGTRTLNGCIQRVKYYPGSLSSASQVAATYPDGSGTSVGTVTAKLAATSNTIPADFMGWSAETADLVNTSYYTGTNTSLIGLAGLLGTGGYVRVGGNSQDTATPPAVTQTTIDNLHAFVSGLGTGWKIGWGLDGGANNSALAVTHAGYVLNDFTTSQVDFALYNEPSIETTQSTWTSVFNGYYTALKAAFPTIKIEATEDDNTLLQSYVNGTSAGLSNLSEASFHFYSQGPTPLPTPAQVLSQWSGNNWSLNTTYAGSKLTLNETNIAFKGGAQGATDRAEAATWIMLGGQTLAPLGYKHLLQHNVLLAGDSTSYSHMGYYNFATQANCSGWCPTPIFYGMWMMSKLSGQQIVANTVSGLSANVTALSTKNGNGNATILVVNADQSNYAVVRPDQSAAWASANVYAYQPASCTDNNPKLNGSTITAGGASVPSATTISYGSTLSIPPCGAALVQIQP